MYSYVLKLDAKDIFCTKAAARLTSYSHRTDSFSFSLRPNPDPWASDSGWIESFWTSYMSAGIQKAQGPQTQTKK